MASAAGRLSASLAAWVAASGAGRISLTTDSSYLKRLLPLQLLSLPRGNAWRCNASHVEVTRGAQHVRSGGTTKSFAWLRGHVLDFGDLIAVAETFALDWGDFAATIVLRDACI